MRTCSLFLAAILLFGAGLWWGTSFERPVVAQDKAGSAAARWEYRVVVWSYNTEAPVVFEGKLNKLGAEGFEVFKVNPTDSASQTIIYTLKRAKKD